MSTAVFCIAPSEAVADSIVSRLKGAGFGDNDISVLLPDKSGTRDFAHEKNTKAPEGAMAGAGAGGVVGGTMGLLAGIGLLAIPGLGPFIAAGPIMASLSGIAAGAAVGGITGALVGMGIPEFEAKRYEDMVKDGNILISVHTDDSDEVDKAEEIFKDEDASDIAKATEPSAPKSESKKNESDVNYRSTPRSEPQSETSTASAARPPTAREPNARPATPSVQPAAGGLSGDRVVR